MKVILQNSEVETAASTLAAFLSERQIDGARAIVEYAAEVYAAIKANGHEVVYKNWDNRI